MFFILFQVAKLKRLLWKPSYLLWSQHIRKFAKTKLNFYINIWPCNFDFADAVGPKQIFLYVAAALILATSLVRLAFDVRNVLRIRYVSILKYGIRVCLYITSILFALIFHAKCQCIALWQWQCGVAAVFLCWITMIIHLSKFPFTGIYVIMLIRVFYTFLKVLFVSSFLVVTFGVTFFMAFHEPSILVSCLVEESSISLLFHS